MGTRLALIAIIIAVGSPLLAALHGWVVLEKRPYRAWRDVEFYPVWAIFAVMTYGLVNSPA